MFCDYTQIGPATEAEWRADYAGGEKAASDEVRCSARGPTESTTLHAVAAIRIAVLEAQSPILSSRS